MEKYICITFRFCGCIISPFFSDIASYYWHTRETTNSSLIFILHSVYYNWYANDRFRDMKTKNQSHEMNYFTVRFNRQQFVLHLIFRSFRKSVQILWIYIPHLWCFCLFHFVEVFLRRVDRSDIKEGLTFYSNAVLMWNGKEMPIFIRSNAILHFRGPEKRKLLHLVELLDLWKPIFFFSKI